MKRLNILAKGNADVRDSLYTLRENGLVTWNGINPVLPASWRARVDHETMIRSDSLLDMPAETPKALKERDLTLGVYSIDTQFITKLFDGRHDAIVLSIQPDVMNRLVRHRTDRHRFYPHEARLWAASDRAWLAAHYDELSPLTPEQSMRNFAALAAKVRRVREVPILIYNLSPIVPWERVHDYGGTTETLGERIRQFNLALIGLSRSDGISIVDVERVTAREGVSRTKRDAVNLTAAGCAAVAGEVVRVLGDLGCFAESVVA